MSAPADAPAVATTAEENEDSPMLWYQMVRGRKRRVSAWDALEDGPVAAPSGGPGCSDEALPDVKRAAATESDEESTSSTALESASEELQSAEIETVGGSWGELVNELAVVDALWSLRPPPVRMT
ncbi:hypothetical protein MRX96_026332 [Rhipicephalus microplus]